MDKDMDKRSFSDFEENETPINIGELFNKYLRCWPWFLGSLMLSLAAAFLYLYHADPLYSTEAKVKLIDDKKNTNFSLDVSRVFSKSAINLENEIALFKSYRLSEQVVRNLKLDVVYMSEGKVIYDPPFTAAYALPQDSISSEIKYDIRITRTGYAIADKESGKTLKTEGYGLSKPAADFPITIRPSGNGSINLFADRDYQVVIMPVQLAGLKLAKEIQAAPVGKDSDIISLSLINSDGRQAQAILNNLIKVFEEDGIRDNQEVSRRTIDFVDNRFVYLKQELDEVEKSKKEYKKRNKLSFLQEDAGASIRIRSEKEQALFDAESQLLLVKMLQDDLIKQRDFSLLPADIGVHSAAVNQLITGYNATVLEYQKLQLSAGRNNPSVQVIESSLRSQKNSILNSVKGYGLQLESARNQGQSAQRAADGAFSALPEKEKVLRSIERQQNLKESLYLLLLQKREEASINLAVTVPNTKIIDYALTDNMPVGPKANSIILLALLTGFFMPFAGLYLLFKFDVKIYSSSDIKKISNSIPVLGELPSLSQSKTNGNKAALKAIEAFKTVAHNAEFITPLTESKLGRIIFVTSSVKGEGKTFVSYSLANAFAQMGKKVLLVGADLRNPQLHRHLNLTIRENKGLSNYLYDNSLKWQDLVLKNNGDGGRDNFSLDVLLSGDIPPNPTLLLSGKRFGILTDQIKEAYDIIVFDTAPTLLVSDTLLVCKYADSTLFVVRSGMTEKKLVSYSSELNRERKLINMGYVINDVAENGRYSYGYGYGYEEAAEKKTLFKRFF